MELQEHINKYQRDYKNRDFIGIAFKDFGEQGNLSDLKAPLDNIRKWLNLFTDVDRKKFSSTAIQDIERLFLSFNDFGRRLEKEYHGRPDEKSKFRNDILDLEEAVLNVLPKYESKINQENLIEQSKLKEEIKESRETIKESVELAQAKVLGSKESLEFASISSEYKKSSKWWLLALLFLSVLVIALTIVIAKPRGSCLIAGESEKNSLVGAGTIANEKANSLSTKHKIGCLVSDRYEVYLPIYIILGTLVTLAYVSHKEGRKKYYHHRQNAVIFDNLNNFIAGKEAPEKANIIDIVFSRLREEDTGIKMNSSDVLNLVRDFSSRFK